MRGGRKGRPSADGRSRGEKVAAAVGDVDDEVVEVIVVVVLVLTVIIGVNTDNAVPREMEVATGNL